MHREGAKNAKKTRNFERLPLFGFLDALCVLSDRRERAVEFRQTEINNTTNAVPSLKGVILSDSEESASVLTSSSFTSFRMTTLGLDVSIFAVCLY